MRVKLIQCDCNCQDNDLYSFRDVVPWDDVSEEDVELIEEWIEVNQHKMAHNVQLVKEIDITPQLMSKFIEEVKADKTKREAAEQAKKEKEQAKLAKEEERRQAKELKTLKKLMEKHGSTLV